MMPAVLQTKTHQLAMRFGAMKVVRESGVAPANMGDGEDVLFSHEFLGAVLALANDVAIGELVVVEALMSSTV